MAAEEGYIAPEIGVGALRDAVAAIRCMASGDREGLHAVLSGTDAPRQLAGMLAAVAAAICRRAGLDEAGIAAVLAGISHEVADLILDQPRPGAAPGR